MNDIIDLRIKEKVYRNKKEVVRVLENFNLRVKKGEMLAVIGKSGAGKTSLLNILGLLDKDFEGSYRIFDRETSDMKSKDMARLRNSKIGFVLQESALINSISMEDNIKLPLLYASKDFTFDKKAFDKILERIGLRPILKKKPLECSGGEKSRAIFARAIIMNPSLILCDEPTASLDPYNSKLIMDLLLKMNKEKNVTVITVTHDMDIANNHGRVVEILRRS
ncbi:MAG: ABC transporter ATP-binding protein [Anaerococcus sp.]|nr:ABC transporter ATP-binding protein [Anaerococcus sp.]